MPNITLAIIGNPNTGKSSLFNALCGMRSRVGNFPGVTVEKKIGLYQDGDNQVTVIDLPGTYSLSSRSSDELISVDVLMGQCPDAPPVDAIAVVVDANHLERDLYLFSQIAELDKPTFLILNMWGLCSIEWNRDRHGKAQPTTWRSNREDDCQSSVWYR